MRKANRHTDHYDVTIKLLRRWRQTEAASHQVRIEPCHLSLSGRERRAPGNWGRTSRPPFWVACLSRGRESVTWPTGRRVRLTARRSNHSPPLTSCPHAKKVSEGFSIRQHLLSQRKEAAGDQSACRNTENYSLAQTCFNGLGTILSRCYFRHFLTYLHDNMSLFTSK